MTAPMLKFSKSIKRRSIELRPELSMQKIDAAKTLWYKEIQTKLEEEEASGSTWEQLAVFDD